MVYAIKRYRKNAKKFVKKRYTKTKSGNLKVSRIARDLAYVKRSLNVEHKHIDFNFGSGQTVATQYPTKDTPIIIALPCPSRGTAFNQRVGNQLRIVHMTSKIQMIFKNNQDLVQRVTASAQILFAKSSDDVPTIDKLYKQDANGHYTPMSMVNTQEYNKYLWIKKLTAHKSHLQPTNRFPASNGSGNTEDPTNGSTADIDVTDPVVTSLNDAVYYINKSTKTSVRQFFENGSDTVITQMTPYILLRSDVVESTPRNYDPVGISGTIRITYVDN